MFQRRKEEGVVIYKDLLVQAGFWSSMFYSMSYPCVHLYLMRGITERLVSLNQIVICIFIIIVNSVWNKHSDSLYKYYKIVLALEATLYFALHIGIILGAVNQIGYYIIDTFLFCLVTKNIICGGNKLRSIIYKDGKREEYDNTIQIVCAMATLFGSAIAIIFDIGVGMAFVLSWVGIAIDNAFYWVAYDKYAELANN